MSRLTRIYRLTLAIRKLRSHDFYWGDYGKETVLAENISQYDDGEIHELTPIHKLPPVWRYNGKTYKTKEAAERAKEKR